MSRLRTYAPMSKRSAKVEGEGPAFRAVYRAVDERSEGRCEVSILAGGYNNGRCPRRGVEHDHLVKPRRSHHTADQVVHICRDHHDRKDWPFKRGRLVYVGRQGRAFMFSIRFQSDKFPAPPSVGPTGTLSPGGERYEPTES